MQRVAVAVLAALLALSHARVHTLTAENFDEKTASGLWFLKFYAPWCGHCKHLAPVLEEVSEKVHGIMNIGKIDCTVESALASRFAVQGYPTLKFRKDGGEFLDYSGGRDVMALATFATRMHGPAVSGVRDVDGVRNLLAGTDVVFLLVHASGAHTATTVAFEKAAGERQHALTFAATTSEEVAKTFNGASLPFIAKMEANEEPLLFSGNTASAAQIGDWVDNNKFPIVSEIGPATFRPLRDSGRKLAVMCVNPDDTSVANAVIEDLLALGRPTSSDLPSTVRDQFLFAHINAIFWSDFLQRYDISTKSLPAILVIDGANDRFYTDPTVKSRSDVASFLARVAGGEAEGKVDGTGLFAKMRRLIDDTWPLSVVVIAFAGFGLVGMIYMLVRVCMEEDEDDEAAIASRIARAEKELETQGEATAATSKADRGSDSGESAPGSGTVRRRRRKAD